MNNSPLGLVYNLNIKEPIMPPGPNPPGDPDFQIIPVPFNKPPLIGLKNVGATCCMNATLQCLTQIQELVINLKIINKYIMLWQNTDKKIKLV